MELPSHNPVQREKEIPQKPGHSPDVKTGVVFASPSRGPLPGIRWGGVVGYAALDAPSKVDELILISRPGKGAYRNGFLRHPGRGAAKKRAEAQVATIRRNRPCQQL